MTPLWRLGGVCWLELAKRTCRNSWEEDVFGQSARLAFYFFFALFPVLLLLILLSAGSAVGGSAGRGALLDSFTQLLPPNASSLIVTTIGQPKRESRPRQRGHTGRPVCRLGSAEWNLGHYDRSEQGL
ncbi:MAG: hypothetical protein M3Y72_11390 [Acidobacteriota bacterium]|nr:hypothetical protein [Acidobacteriota bacterium]